jgi:hypothetical protein
MRMALRLVVLASIAAAWLALSGPASAYGPCYVQEKTPTGFKLKCSVQLYTGSTVNDNYAITIGSPSATPLAAVSVSSPSGVTCSKDPSYNHFDCSGTIPANTEIVGNVSYSGGQSPCEVQIFGSITYNDGQEQNPSIGSFADCSDQPPPKNPTDGRVTCAPKVVLIDQPTTCTVTVADDENDGTRPTGKVAFTNDPASAGSFPAGATCTLAPVEDVPRNSSCEVKYQPKSLGFTGSHKIKAGYNGDAGHLASLGETTVTVKRRPTATKIACDPAKPRVGKKTDCTVTVSDTGPGTKSSPTGKVTMSGPAAKGKFPDGASCTLKKGDRPGEAQCTVVYKPTKKGGRELKAAYPGDTKHLASAGTLTLKVKKKKPKN